MIKLFLILIIQEILRYGNIWVFGNAINNNQCRDPDEDYLGRLFIDYEMTYRKYEEIVFKTKTFEEKINSSYIIRITRENLFENTECLMSSRRTLDVSKKSLCPWKSVITYRQDRFPFYKLENKCTCSKCSLIGDKFLDVNSFGCSPVIETVPVLVRGKCGSDGFFIWEPSLEESNLYCTCSLLTSLIPV
ncbi:hypothetical protein BpHYR1_040951 [Brachionus plicatilis]|uniref:Interleukin 17-like protein n=1 Tax=Brachionus plicatilis TaxID=10195 RepID=A0A3M7T456_BRAPC|nr:hypothetical protein BpHYR1_040951 [Brachionus plicatilis]